MLSELAAGRLKGTEMVAALVAFKLADIDTHRARIAHASRTHRARIAAVPGLHMPTILLARLQLVLENAAS